MSSGASKVTLKEHNLTLSVIGSSASDFASIGAFSWGAVNSPRKLNFSADEFSYRYGKPNDKNFIQHAIVEDHLQHNSSVWINRVAGINASNANSSGVYLRIDNDQDYKQSYDNGLLNQIPFVGRFPGSLVNGLRVDVITKDSYNDYPYKDSFKEAPLQDGEFHIAVLDTSGKISGNGAIKQKERISISTRNIVPLQTTLQDESITVSCVEPVWTNGQRHSVKLVISGTSDLANKTLKVFGYDVNFTNKMTASEVVAEIKSVLVDSKQFIEVVPVQSGLKVTFLNPAPKQHFANISEDGISITYNILDSGWLEYKFQYAGVNMVYRYSMYSPIVNHANAIASIISDNIQNSPIAKTSTAKSIGNVVTVTRSIPGAVEKLPEFHNNGMHIQTSVVVVGSITTSLSFDNTRINMTLTNVNPVVDIANYVKTYLDQTLRYDAVTIEGSTIYVVSKQNGIQRKLGSVYESGIMLNCTVTNYGFNGELIEKYQNLKALPDSKKPNGKDAYYVSVVNKSSNYIWCGEDLDTTCYGEFSLSGGIDDYDVSLSTGMKMLESKSMYPMRGLFLYSEQIFDYMAAVDLCEKRMDCVAYFSVPSDVVFRNASERAQSAVEWRNYTLARNSSYQFIDTGWGEFYDKYSNTYKWIPACGQTSAMAAKLFAIEEFQKPISGIENGGYSYKSMAWVANEEEMDLLYDNQLNPVTIELGSLCLFGQKMGTSINSAFNRLNVRNTFIVVENDVYLFSRYFLHQLHDAPTYRKYELAVTNYLNNRKTQGCIDDFYFVPLEQINTASTKSENKMIVKIGILPKFAIEYIDLNFYAVNDAVLFNEIVNF